MSAKGVVGSVSKVDQVAAQLGEARTAELDAEIKTVRGGHAMIMAVFEKAVAAGRGEVPMAEAEYYRENLVLSAEFSTFL